MSDREFDVIVIGAGPAGEVFAARVAARGHSTAIVESDLLGGECSYYACMPSKALLRPIELLLETHRVPGVHEACPGALDPAVIFKRRDDVISHLDDSGQASWIENAGVALVRGHARIEGERLVRVGDELLEARTAVVIATGTVAAMPPIPGLADAKPWSNREATTADAVPPRLLVLGGGVVGCELAQAFASLGSTVTLVEGLPTILSREEPFVAAEVAQALRETHGVTVIEGAMATAVARPQAGGEVTMTLASGDELTGDELLVAVGRKPLTADIGLETIGLEPGKYVEVDDRMQVAGHSWLYAIGDANGRSLLTHSGKYQARILSLVLDGDERAVCRQDGPGAPRVVFTDPQVAAVGVTEAAARDAGIDVLTVSYPTSGTAGASFVGRNTLGTSQLVIDREREVIVGATFVGFKVDDMLQAATVAVVNEIPIAGLWESVAPFPTRSEVWLRLLEAYEAA